MKKQMDMAKSLEYSKLVNKVLGEVVSELGFRVWLRFRDVVRYKGIMVGRRSKFICSLDENGIKWLSTEQVDTIVKIVKERLGESDYNVVIEPVNKLMSMGGAKEVDYRRDSWVEMGMGTVEEYDDKFDNYHYYIIVRITDK